MVGVPVRYYPRISKSNISGTLKGAVGAGLVHSQLDRAILFSPSKSEDRTASTRVGQSLPAARSHRLFGLDPQGESHPGNVTTGGPSTPQIIAFAMICSGRDDRGGET